MRLVDDVDLVAALDRLQHGAVADLAHSSMPRCEAASISITSSELPLAIASAIGVVGSKSAFGPPSALSALARMRAIEVFPVPRGPANRYACRTWPVLDRVPQRPHDGLLADHVAEVERAVGAVEGGHGPDTSSWIIRHISAEALPQEVVPRP